MFVLYTNTDAMTSCENRNLLEWLLIATYSMNNLGITIDTVSSTKKSGMARGASQSSLACWSSGRAVHKLLQNV